MHNKIHKAKVIFVIGMHRSGTSLLANVLSTLGLSLSSHLIQADANNQKGYWEQSNIVEIQEDLLRHLHREWITPVGTIPFLPQWWKQPDIQPYKEKLQYILSQEIQIPHPHGYAFKDPRTTRFLPMWKEIVYELDIDAYYLFTFRNPLSVAQSLIKRDHISQSHAELIWLIYNLEGLIHIKNDQKLILNYDEWFSNASGLIDNLSTFLNLNITNPDLKKHIHTNVISPSLRHHGSPPTKYILDETCLLYDLLLQIKNQQPNYIQLEKIYHDVQHSMSLLQSWSQHMEQLHKTLHQ